MMNFIFGCIVVIVALFIGAKIDEYGSFHNWVNSHKPVINKDEYDINTYIAYCKERYTEEDFKKCIIATMRHDKWL